MVNIEEIRKNAPEWATHYFFDEDSNEPIYFNLNFEYYNSFYNKWIPTSTDYNHLKPLY